MQEWVLGCVRLQAADAPLDSQQVAGMNGSAMRGLLDANSEQPQAAVLAGLADQTQAPPPALSGDLISTMPLHTVIKHMLIHGNCPALWCCGLAAIDAALRCRTPCFVFRPIVHAASCFVFCPVVHAL